MTAHMLDLQEYGVTKQWVIITETSKEVEKNTIARVNAYLDVLDPTFVYTFICVEIKSNTETVVPGMFKRCRGQWGCQRPDFCYFYPEGVFEGRHRTDLFLSFQFFTFCLTYYQPYESMTGPIGQRAMSYLLTYLEW